MGWLIFAAMAAAAYLVIRRFAVLPSGAGTLTLAALVLAGAGYAWQGSPGFAGAPVTGQERMTVPEFGSVELRRQLNGERFSQDALYLDLADTMLQRGRTALAVTAIRSGLNKNPQSAALWTGLGNALVAHSEGLLSPAARFAYGRAVRLSPAHPGPWYYLGLAELRQGRPLETQRLWGEALRRGDPQGSWRPEVEERLRTLDAMLTARGAP